MYIPTGELYLHSHLDPASQSVNDIVQVSIYLLYLPVSGNNEIAQYSDHKVL